MYLAQSSNSIQAQAPFYIKTLQNIIENIDTHEKEGIDTAITEAKQVAMGEKEIFTIDNNHYFFIITLLTHFSDELRILDNNNLKKQNYRAILELMK